MSARPLAVESWSGRYVAVVAEVVWVLADVAPDASVVALLRAAAGEAEPVDAVLDVILAEGLRSVPSFAVAGRQGDELRVLVRGALTARLVGEDNDVIVDAGTERTWVDRRIPVPVAVELGEVRADGGMTLWTGVVQTSGLRITLAGSREVVHQEDPQREALSPVTPSVESLPPPASVLPDDGQGVTTDRPDFDFLFGATRSPAGPPQLPVDTGQTQIPEATELPAELLVGGSAAVGRKEHPAESYPPSDESADPGESVGSAESDRVAARQPAAPGLIDALPWELAPPPAGDPLPGPVPTAVPPPPESAVQEAGAVPGPVAPSPPAPPRPEPVQGGGPDVAIGDATISRAALRAQLAAGPTVLSATCPDGHLSPAYAAVCRVCGLPMPAQQPVEVPRPVLGRLVLSTGDVVTLDRGVLLGRNPSLPDVPVAERPHILRLGVDGKDISREHLEVRLDGWHVLVCDLGSTNFTEITLPGEEPVQLRAHEPVSIEPGTVVSLAEVVTFTYEVIG